MKPLPPWYRVALGILAVVVLEVAVWGLLAPRSFYTDFPGGGRHWVAALGTYNEHLLRDYAGALLGVGALAVWAAFTLDRRLVQAALVAIGVGAAPHLLYHLTTTSHFATIDNIGSLGGLAFEVVAPAALLVLIARQ